MTKFSSAVARDFPYRHVFNLMIKRLREQGILDLLK